MRKRTREIIALVLLGVLAAIVAVAMGYYILIGHNWNVAASNIDDQLGTMDGYSVVLYRGTLKPPANETAAKAGEEPARSSASSTASATTASSADGDLARVQEISREYRSKGAEVFTLNIGQTRWYRQPMVLREGGKSVGVFTLGKRALPVQALTAIRALRVRGCDCIVAISEDDSICSHPISGLDMVICPGDDLLPDSGEYQGRTYCIGDVPSNEVRAVIISPSGVYSSKAVA